MKISFIATVYNEENTIQYLLDSIAVQSLLPDEVIIVDGGSTDATASVISNFKFLPADRQGQISNKQIKPKLTLIKKEGNRAVGRNEAIKNASGDIIVCSDAGCILDKDWVKNISAPFVLEQTDVVAGYYAAKPKSIFQKCLVPYVLVMPDRVDPNNFLPATRSTAFKKTVWEKTGGFPEEYSNNEDYIWAKKLKKNGFTIVFAKNAIVYWLPRKNLIEAINMFFRFAYGDAEAGILRLKVLFLFARYIIGLGILVFAIIAGFSLLISVLCFIFLAYIIWSVVKNFRYVQHIWAFFLLPVLQVTADISVIIGTSMGLIQKFLGGGYTKDTIRGVSWMGALRGATRGISFVRIAILARVLSPLQFGAFAVASLVLSFLEVVTETGVNIILVQEKGDIEDYINSAWVLSIIRGCIVALFIFLTAPLVASFFHSEESLMLLRLIAVVPIIRGLINPSVVKFQKNLQFGKEFWFRFFVFAVDAFAAIFFALTTKQASSIVYGLIVGASFEMIISFFIVSPRPTFRLELRYLKKIFHRGKWVTLYGVFHYLFQNGDNIVVGKLLNTQSLGIYQMAYSLSILPISEVADVVSRVTFPIYTKIADDKARLKAAFLRTITVVSILTIPFGFFLFFFPAEIVSIVLGSKWTTAVPVLRILAVFGVIRAICGSASALFISVGKQEYVTVVTLISILGLAVSIVPLVLRFGIIGAAISAIIGSIIALPVFIFFVIKILTNFKIKNSVLNI